MKNISINFTEKVVDKYVRNILHKSIIDDITEDDLQPISTIEINDGLLGSMDDFTRFPNLRILDLSECTFMCGFEPLAEIRGLKGLHLVGTGFEDLSPLLDLSLMALSLGGCYPADLSLLSRMKRLRSLDLCENNLTTIDFLSGLSLEMLNVRDNSICDISPLANMANMQVLNIANNNITDLGPLASMAKLRMLDFHSNFVGSVQPIKGLGNLRDITSYDNPVDPLPYFCAAV